MKSIEECNNCPFIEKIEKLELELLNTTKRYEELISLPNVLKGMKGEDLITYIIGGTRTLRTEAFDIVLENGRKVEVKYSGHSIANKNMITRRWAWNWTLGRSGRKEYDYLILIGDKDFRYQKYEEDNSNYIFFLLNKHDVPDVVLPSHKKTGLILLCTNSKRAISDRSKRIWKHRVNAEEMKKFFDSMVVKS